MWPIYLKRYEYEYPTTHYFGNPRHTLSMIAYISLFWLSISGNSCENLHCGNVVYRPYYNMHLLVCTLSNNIQAMLYFNVIKVLVYLFKNQSTHTVPLPIILVKSTMVQSTSTNNIGRDYYTIPLNFNNGPVPRYAQLMLWSGFQWVCAMVLS